MLYLPGMLETALQRWFDKFWEGYWWLSLAFVLEGSGD